MPIIPTPLPASGPQVTALHNTLIALGFTIPSAELGSPPGNGVFGPQTRAAVITFRQNMDLPPLPATESPFDAAAARLLNVVFQANGTESDLLSAAVRESLAAAQGATPIEIEWLVRYATVARDFTAARQAVAMAPADAAITTLVQPIIGDAKFQTPNPELQNPENFYTCRYDFVPQAALDEMLGRSGGSSARLRLARRRPAPKDGSADWPEVPPDLPDPPPPPPPAIPQRLHEFETSALRWIEAVDFWQKGHREFKAQRYANAVANYNEAQESAAAYFETIYKIPRSGPLARRLVTIITKLASSESEFPTLWGAIRRRRTALTLAELQQLDWSGYSFALSGSHNLLRKNLEASNDPTRAEDTGAERITRQFVLDRFALLLAMVFVPLARSEANRMRRFFGDAIADLQRVQTPFRFSNVVGGGGGGPLDPNVILINPNPVSPALPAAAQPVKSAVNLLTRGRPVWLTCDFIERPFVRLVIGETLLERAETEYKADTPADSNLPALPIVANEKPEDWPRKGFKFATHGLRAAQTYLEVFGLFDDVGAYAERVLNGRDELARGADDPNAPDFRNVGKKVTLPAKGSNAPTVQSTSPSLPGLSRSKAPAESWLKPVSAVNGEVVSETNPRVYALLLMTQARLEQVKYNFNYLGYSDDYVPPWRFQFLLERARYFVEHAKSAQREYLNFLSNAEREEFQELSAAQNVEMEKSNVRIETARVDQVQLEVTAAQQSAVLARISAENSNTRLTNFEAFDKFMDEKESHSFLGSIAGAVALTGVVALGVATGPGGAAALISLAGAAKVGEVAVKGASDAFNRHIENSKTNEQRELEKKNLKLAIREANQAAKVSIAQLAVARAGLLVAGLQRQAALLRHEFALQNLQFLRNRTLNAELWYRLMAAIRSVSETYLRYSIELAFLAEQAYEFEADKRINVIRFDYDLSEVGDFLAADFLLRDLDTLEKDLIVTQRQRQQHVRYVLSLAREFPEALQEIRDTGIAQFSLRLEQLEKRFPGLYNLRIGAVDVLPVALMDSTRFSMEVTHLGTSQVRLKAQPDTEPGVASTSPFNQDDLEPFLFAVPAKVFADELDQGTFSDQFRKQFTKNKVNISPKTEVTQVEPKLVWRLSSTESDEKFLVRRQQEKLHVYLINVDDDWLRDIRDEWPVKLRVTGPETAVFSGLTRQDASAIFAFATSAQRQAFEALGAAAAWQVDFTARENQVVPGTLADVLITLTLSGYHDPELRRAIDLSPRITTAATRFLSGQSTFPDALYEFNRSGRMVWNVTNDLLTLTDTLGAVRNAALLLLPAPGKTNYYGRLMNQCEVRVRIDKEGKLEVLSEIPEVTFTLGDAANPLSLTAQATKPTGVEISWDFGDGSARQSGASQQHSYAKPGRYTVSLRIVRKGRLSEFRSEVVVSRSQAARLLAPVTAFPKITRETGTDIPAGHTRVKGTLKAQAGDPVTAIWRAGKQGSQKGNSATFDLQPGDYTLFFTAVRKLKARVYCTQRHLTAPVFDFNGLSLASNRRFDLDGKEITGVGDNPPANPVTKHLFGGGAISPVDEWTVEIPLTDNPCLRSVSGTDIEQYDLAEIQDVVLALEYETTTGVF